MRSVDRAPPILKAGYSTRYAFLPDKMDPDEYLKAKGRDEFLKIIGDTVPLAELVWRKNIQSKDLSTPEQKALIEKNIMEEVGKIADEKVRGYYIQEMKNRIYEEFGRGAWKDRRGGDSRRKAPAAAKKPVQIRPKPSLDELVLKFVLAAFVYYPELIPEYEEKMSFFDFNNQRMHTMFDKMVDICAENEQTTFADMYKKLAECGFDKDLASLWELDMFKQQNPYLPKIRAEIDTKIIEVQLRQLENEIRECLRIIQTSESFPDEVYKRYESLKKEKEALLDTQNFN